MYLIIAVLFGLLAYVSFVAYAKEFRAVRQYYIIGFTFWKTLTKSDFKELAKGARKSPVSLRSLYQGGYDIIFYPIVGVVIGLGSVIRNSHKAALQNTQNQ